MGGQISAVVMKDVTSQCFREPLVSLLCHSLAFVSFCCRQEPNARRFLFDKKSRARFLHGAPNGFLAFDV